MSSSVRTPFINVARITRTHGRNGEVVVAPLDGLSFCLRRGLQVYLTPYALHDQRLYTVERVNATDPSLVGFKGVSSIGDAEALVGRLVLVRSDEVPDVAHEHALQDCVGRELIDAVRGPIGIIAERLVLPANDVWVVRGDRFGEVLVPIIDDVVGAIPEDGPIEVTLLPGLLPEGR